MNKTYTIPLEITQGYRSSSGGASSTTLNWSTAYSTKYMGRNSNYRFATTMRSTSADMVKVSQINPAKIVSITLHIVTSSSAPSYDLDMYCGALVNESGKSTIATSNAVTWLKAATEMRFNITSCGIPSTLGYAIGDNTKNATAIILGSAELIVVVDTGLEGKLFVDGSARTAEQAYLYAGGSWHSVEGTSVFYEGAWHNQ